MGGGAAANRVDGRVSDWSQQAKQCQQFLNFHIFVSRSIEFDAVFLQNEAKLVFANVSILIYVKNRLIVLECLFADSQSSPQKSIMKQLFQFVLIDHIVLVLIVSLEDFMNSLLIVSQLGLGCHLVSQFLILFEFILLLFPVFLLSHLYYYRIGNFVKINRLVFECEKAS